MLMTDPQNVSLGYWIVHYVHYSNTHRSICYIRDTTDVINKVAKLDLGTAGKEAILFSMDVPSLYPNIPQFEWIDCTLDLFGRHPPYILRLKVVKRLLEKVLTRNLTYNHFLVIVVIYNQSSMVTSLYSRTE